MLDILRDGLSSLFLHRVEIVLYFVAILGLGNFLLGMAGTRQIDPAIKIPAWLSVGAVALTVITYLIAWIGHFLPSLYRPASFLVWLYALVMLIRGIRLEENKGILSRRTAVILVSLLVILIARLAYLDHILLPSYSDSPLHYEIVSDLLHPGGGYAIQLSIGNTLDQYYHLGFHSQVAWLSSLTGISPEDGISLLGQLHLVLVPVSIIFLAWHLTGSVEGALFAGLSAAAAWSMPAFAVNWGKFPALSALAMLPAALAFIGHYLPGNLRSRRIILISLLLLGGITLLHTRIIVCAVLAIGCTFLANKLLDSGELGFFQAFRLSLLFILSMIPIYQLIFDFYSWFPSALAWLILLPFAFQAFPRLSLAVVLYTLGAWFIALVPPLLLKDAPALIDRQFLEIMLFIPFSLLGGAGFAGMLKKLAGNMAARRAASLGAILFTVLMFITGESLLPNSCCLLYEEDDRLAFQWLEKNVSPDDLILIATANAKENATGTDAGIWIQPLLGLNTNKMPYDKNWNTQKTRDEICQSNAGSLFIYAGGRQYSFSDSILAPGNMTQPVFSSGDVTIYKFTC